MKKLFFIACLIVSSFFTKAQGDLYNYENSRQFGKYLLKSGQFELATKEFERLVFLNATNDSLKLDLLKAYRLSDKFETGILRAQQLFPETSAMPLAHSIEYSKLLMNTRQWDVANQFWEESQSLPPTEKQLLNTSASIFTGDFKAAKTYLNLLNDSTNLLGLNYKRIVDEGLNGKYKNPALAGTLSTVIPGLGRVYTNDWKDGLVSLIFTAGMAFQSYRGFNAKGINSARGWAYGGIGLGFYLGNIYGSVKSAKNKKKKKINALQHEASSLFNVYYN